MCPRGGDARSAAPRAAGRILRRSQGPGCHGDGSAGSRRARAESRGSYLKGRPGLLGPLRCLPPEFETAAARLPALLGTETITHMQRR